MERTRKGFHEVRMFLKKRMWPQPRLRRQPHTEPDETRGRSATHGGARRQVRFSSCRCHLVGGPAGGACVAMSSASLQKSEDNLFKGLIERNLPPALQWRSQPFKWSFDREGKLTIVAGAYPPPHAAA